MLKIGKLLTGLVSNKNGLLSLISEKTGKISFKRSAAIILLTTIVVPDYSLNGLTILNVSLAVGCLAAVALPKIFSKDSE